MKKLIIVILLFIGVLTCCSCTTEIQEQNKIEVSDSKLVCKINDVYIHKIKVGNHEYLYSCYDRSFSMCHYEDCEYCCKRK